MPTLRSTSLAWIGPHLAALGLATSRCAASRRTTPGHTPLDMAPPGLAALGLALGLAVPGLAAGGPTEDPPPDTKRWILISATHTDPEEARAALASLETEVRTRTGYPQVVASAQVPGLKPGFHVVVLAACDDRDDALLLQDLAQLTVPDAYLRRVVWPRASCDNRSMPPPSALSPEERAQLYAPHPYEQIGSLPLVPGGTDWRWTIHTFSPPGCPSQGLEVRLEHHSGVILDSYSREPDCLEPDTAVGGLGGYTRWERVTEVTLSGRTQLVLQRYGMMGDNGFQQDVLLGLRCGRITELLERFAGHYGTGPTFPQTYRADGDMLEILGWGPGADPQGPPTGVERYTWAPGGCGLARVSADTAPADTAPADTAPADTAPADTAPADTAPADTAPTGTVPAPAPAGVDPAAPAPAPAPAGVDPAAPASAPPPAP